MAETIVLDPSAVATSRTQVDITSWVSADEGVDWGDAAIEAYMADAARGSNPVDFRIPNRTVAIPLTLRTVGATSFDTIRQQVQAKVGLFQREGGWISRQTTVGTVYADVVNATLKLGGSWLQAYKNADVDATLTLELTPDWYGAEITLDDKVETTASALVTVLKQSAADAVVKGDHPGRVRVVVDEDDADAQLGLLGAFRSRYYDSATTAQIMYEAEALTPLDSAAIATRSGASGGASNNVISHSAIRTDWTAMLSTQILSGSAHMTHKGTYRVWARVYPNDVSLEMRFVWGVGDIAAPTENASVTLSDTTSSSFFWVDLGEVRLTPALVGTHRWQGQIEARQTNVSGGKQIDIDEVHIVPVDDAYWLLQASSTVRAPTSYSQTDLYAGTTAGNALNARVAPTGGTWATSGDATDFAFSDDLSGENLKRSAGSGTNGRFAVLGTTNFTDVQVESLVYHNADMTVLAAGSTARLGVIARYVDNSNYARGTIQLIKDALGTKLIRFGVDRVIAGSSFEVAGGYIYPGLNTFGTWYAIRLTIYATGRAVVQLLDSTRSVVIVEKSGTHTDFATGGTLASGKNGVWDRNTSATGTIDRYYDDFRGAAAPAADAIMYPSQSCEIRTDGVFRENSAGTAYTGVTPLGSLPRIPTSGLESRKVELYVNASRGDFNGVPDAGIDDISAQVFYRPSWLFVQGS